MDCTLHANEEYACIQITLLELYEHYGHMNMWAQELEDIEHIYSLNGITKRRPLTDSPTLCKDKNDKTTETGLDVSTSSLHNCLQ